METPIVVIEVECGIATAYRSEGVILVIHDRDTEGNDEGEKYRKKNEKSFKKLTKKLVCTDGMGANEALEAIESPVAPVDWAKRLETILQWREEALASIGGGGHNMNDVSTQRLIEIATDIQAADRCMKALEGGKAQ